MRASQPEPAMRTPPPSRTPRDTDADAALARARESFRAFALARGWSVETRDGLDDYFEERTFYAWLGWRGATGGAR